MARAKLILVELNEVPYRVLDAYQRERPHSNLSKLLARSAQYTTVTEDSLALDPWISWPTLHRGVTDQTHQILHLGQVLDDVDAAFPPIWRLLKERQLSVGVFGSLHSSHVPADATDYSFYIPDYFDENVFAHPRSLRAFQELNITMTRRSARNITRKLPLGALARFMASAPGAGLGLGTAMDSGAQLLREMFNSSLRIRRRAYQPLVMSDLFLHQLTRTRPDFATFYTNHVAAAMHRYWGAAFPEDYEHPLDDDWIREYSGEISFAMDKFDKILGRLMAFVDRNSGHTLLVASSMGQAAIPARQTFEFLTITELPTFMAQLGVPPGSWQARPAMVPSVCVVVHERFREQVLSRLESLSIHGEKLVRDKRPIAPMSFDERERGFFHFFIQFDSYDGPPNAHFGGRQWSLAELGLGLMAHEDGVNCTAQHVREGSLLVYRPDRDRAPQGRETISTLDLAPSILRYFGFEAPSHMRGTPTAL